MMKEVDLLLVGDSITHGWENAGRKVWEKYYSKRNCFNIGFSGDRTEHVIWRFQNGEIDGISPKMAMVMIGTNNSGLAMQTAEQTAAGVGRVLEELRLRLPKTKVLLLSIFPRDAEPTDKKRLRNDKVNQLIKSFADEKNVWFLDIGDRFLEENGSLPKSIMPDLLHPNAEGYQIWAEAVEPMVQQLMGE